MNSIAVQTFFLVLFAMTGCRERQVHMTEWNMGDTRQWCVGRFYLRLPEASALNWGGQEVDGITLKLERLGENESFETILIQRRKAILQNPHSPLIKEYRWARDMAGILYVGNTSDPTYLTLEGRRLFGQQIFLAASDGDQSKTAVMENIVTEALRNYRPGESADGKTPGFCIQGGTLRQVFRNGEEIHASFRIPQPGALLEIDTEVVERPGRVNLIERSSKMAPLAKLDNVFIVTLRQGAKEVAGLKGEEVVIAGTERSYTSFDARFEAGGRSMSPQEPELHLHLTTGQETGYRSGSMTKEQFLAFWDATLRSITTHP